MSKTHSATGHKLHSVALRYRHEFTPTGDGIRPRFITQRNSSPLGGTGPAVQPAERHPLARDLLLARLEAVLFLAREPLPSRKLAVLARLADGTEARTLVRRLNRLYDLGGSPIRVEEVAGGFQLLTRTKFAAWLRRLYHSPSHARISAPALETLAVVAYRQPVMRAEIEAIRGVQCDDILRQLMDRELVRILGRADELGRPLLYGTTRRFLQIFGLRHLDDLPNSAALRGGNPPRTTENSAPPSAATA